MKYSPFYIFHMISTKNYVELTYENILKKISSYDIFKYYIPEFKDVSTPFTSPLREDKKPDVRIFKTKSGEFLYKDFAKQEHVFNAPQFVMEYHMLSYPEALQRINIDFHLRLGKNPLIGGKKPPKLMKKADLEKIKTYKSLRIVSKKFSSLDMCYFFKYNIKMSTLNKFNVKALRGYYINGSYFPTDKKTSFAYCFGNYKYKILQPYDEVNKWITNTSAQDIQGWEQLPEKGDICFITSSLKDVMVLYEIGYPAVAPQNETGKLPLEMIQELKDRFNHVIILYDSDKPGKDAARQLSALTDLPYVYIPDVIEEKDPADLSWKQGLDKLKIIIDSII